MKDPFTSAFMVGPPGPRGKPGTLGQDGQAERDSPHALRFTLVLLVGRMLGRQQTGVAKSVSLEFQLPGTQ